MRLDIFINRMAQTAILSVNNGERVPSYNDDVTKMTEDMNKDINSIGISYTNTYDIVERTTAPILPPQKSNNSKKVIGYDLVYALSYSGLRDNVNKMLEEGWDIVGQAFFADGNWNQTIVKY